MKKGINSLDAFIAITMMLFVTIWLQNFFNINLGGSENYGMQLEMSMKAIREGSIMNSFYAIDPSPYDYMILNDSAKGFSGSTAVSIEKSGNEIKTSATYGSVLYSAAYPVVSDLKYDTVSKKVTR
jgi:hypothetical protein